MDARGRPALRPEERASYVRGGPLLGPVGLLDQVGSGIAAGQKPLLAAVAVIPPFDLRAGDIPPEEEVARQLARRAVGRRPLVRLTTEAELADFPTSAVRTTHEERHAEWRALPLGCLRARSSRALTTRAAIVSGVSAVSVPASGMPVIIDASRVRARMSSASR